MNILFWNINNQSRVDQIIALILSHSCDLAVFAEYADDDSEVLRGLLHSGLTYYALPTIGCDRIKIFTNRRLNSFSIKKETSRFSFREFKSPGMIPTLLCMVHLPSKLHMGEVDQAMSAMYFKQDVEEAEKVVGHRNTVVFGDFNMNPYDPGMYLANALNSVSCRRVAATGKRTIESREHSYFYNPSWNLLGDQEGVPGSYYHNSGAYEKNHWNLLDQVIIRPELVSRFDIESLDVLTEAGGQSLVSEANRPKLSDHLPIFFSLNLEFEVENEKSMA